MPSIKKNRPNKRLRLAKKAALAKQSGYLADHHQHTIRYWLQELDIVINKPTTLSHTERAKKKADIITKLLAFALRANRPILDDPKSEAKIKDLVHLKAGQTLFAQGKKDPKFDWAKFNMLTELYSLK